jgi:iron complex outermembrane receptor protein
MAMRPMVKLLSGAGALALATMSMPATAQDQAMPAQPLPTEQEPSAAASGGLGDIVVTARRREEGLITVPVSVTAIGAAELVRYRTDNLEKVGELTPGVVIAQTKTAAGGTIGVRGISTSAATVGFEQPVLINFDGIPVSNGRVVAMGFFDLQRVEVLKGPQALLFGKNNSAGVISLVSADPGNVLSGYVKAGYEFVADEAFVEGAFGGPMTDTLGARIAFRGRTMKGWMYNDARAAPNPFAPAFPTSEPDRRLGDRDFAGRITLKWQPSQAFDATFKGLYSHSSDDGFGNGNQVIGGCLNGQPRIRNVVDPFGECRRDNHTTAGVPNAIVLANGPNPKGAYGKLDAIVTSLNMTYDFGQAALTSTTGYLYWDSEAAGSGEVSSFAQLFGSEPQTVKSFSQEVRLLTSFDSAFNFMIGGFYQDLDFNYEQNVKLSEIANFNPANGKFIAWLRPGYTYGKTYSAFGQLIVRPTDKLEIAGGARWTHETKDSYMINAYTFQAGFPQGKALSDYFKDSNISPEASVSYHPTPSSTIYAAYKTGFKSGGFALSGTIQTATLASDLAFNSESARGFEIGAKGFLFDSTLRLEAVAYAYNFDDLQVNTYNPATVSYTFSNAASMKQRGVDLQALWQATPNFQLRGAVNYNRNRFGRYLAQCYGLQTAAQGCNVLPGPAQDQTGRAPARSPDWAGNAGVSLDIPSGNGWKINLTGDAFYSGSYFGSETLAPSTLQESFWRFNAGARLVGDGDRWEVALIGRNLTNNYYLLTAQDKSNQPGDQRGTVARGRELTIQLGYRF